MVEEFESRYAKKQREAAAGEAAASESDAKEEAVIDIPQTVRDAGVAYWNLRHDGKSRPNVAYIEASEGLSDSDLKQFKDLANALDRAIVLESDVVSGKNYDVRLGELSTGLINNEMPLFAEAIKIGRIKRDYSRTQYEELPPDDKFAPPPQDGHVLTPHSRINGSDPIANVATPAHTPPAQVPPTTHVAPATPPIQRPAPRQIVQPERVVPAGTEVVGNLKADPTNQADPLTPEETTREEPATIQSRVTEIEGEHERMVAQRMLKATKEIADEIPSIVEELSLHYTPLTKQLSDRRPAELVPQIKSAVMAFATREPEKLEEVVRRFRALKDFLSGRYKKEMGEIVDASQENNIRPEALIYALQKPTGREAVKELGKKIRSEYGVFRKIARFFSLGLLFTGEKKAEQLIHKYKPRYRESENQLTRLSIDFGSMLHKDRIREQPNNA